MKLDKSKPFGTNHPVADDGCKYIQNGRRFDGAGNEIKKVKVEPVKVEK